MTTFNYALYETDSSKYVEAHRWQASAGARLARRLLRGRAYTRWTDAAFTRIDVRGLDHLKRLDSPAVFIANHQSHLDTLLVHAALPENIRSRLFFGAAQDRWYLRGQKKIELMPWYQSLALGNFPIRRGGGSQALAHASWLLEQGNSVFLFPEGTRARGSQLGEFRPGPALLAQQLNVPVVPLYLAGLKAIRPQGSRSVVPGPASVDVLTPLAPADFSDVRGLLACMQAKMQKRHQHTLEKELQLVSVPV